MGMGRGRGHVVLRERWRDGMEWDGMEERKKKITEVVTKSRW